MITSQWLRAKDTAQPLADLLKIIPEVVPTADPPQEYFEATANALRWHNDGAVLIVGHITVPNVIAALGGPHLPTICETRICSCRFRLWDGTFSQGCITALERTFRRAAEICLSH